MTIVKQKFNPPLRICKNRSEEVCSISERLWYAEENTDELRNASKCFSDIGYIGSMQIEENWKHYYKGYDVSNYGYVVKIKDEDKEKAEKIIPEELKKADEVSSGYRWLDFSDELKNLFRENALVPKNRQNSGRQICLNITGKTADYDIHKIIARFFLTKPENYIEKKYVVHHIDNNSYNNSVTNLIYLAADTHIGNQHKIYHPMSHK